MSHDRVRHMVDNLRQRADTVHNRRQEKHRHHQAWERAKQRTANCHEHLRKHNAVSPQVKTQHGWMHRLHELRVALDDAQKNQNHEYEQVARANAHIATAITQFNEQQARVYTEYNKVLKIHVPPGVKQMVESVHKRR